MPEEDVVRSGDRRADLLAALGSAGRPLTIAVLAERLSVHPNTVRFHLDKLVASGRVERLPAEHDRPGRPALTYRKVPGMDPTGPRHYRLLAEMLLSDVAAGPDPGDRAERVGRAWAAGLADADHEEGDPVERLVAVLTDLGFAPQRSGAGQIELGHCPFLELLPIGPGLVCRLHLGLMRGALQAWTVATAIDRLQPFAAPDRCVTHLRAA